MTQCTCATRLRPSLSSVRSTKAAARRLIVSVCTLLAAIIDLLASVVRLLTRAAVVGAEALSKKTAPAPLTQKVALHYRAESFTGAHKAESYTGAVWHTAVPVERTAEKERLSCALAGLGFKQAAVRQYVSSVEGRIAQGEAIETLIKDGLRALCVVRAS